MEGPDAGFAGIPTSVCHSGRLRVRAMLLQHTLRRYPDTERSVATPLNLCMQGFGLRVLFAEARGHDMRQRSR